METRAVTCALAIAAFVLAGCGDDSDSEETRQVTKPPVTETVTPTTTVTRDAPETNTETQETQTEVVQPTDTVTAPPSTHTEVEQP